MLGMPKGEPSEGAALKRGVISSLTPPSDLEASGNRKRVAV
jgi:hypothetical protein